MSDGLGRAYLPYHNGMESRTENSRMEIQRWYVEWLEGTLEGASWRRLQGRWVFEAAVAKARDIAIAKGTTSRLVKAR